MHLAGQSRHKSKSNMGLNGWWEIGPPTEMILFCSSFYISWRNEWPWAPELQKQKDNNPDKVYELKFKTQQIINQFASSALIGLSKFLSVKSEPSNIPTRPHGQIYNCDIDTIQISSIPKTIGCLSQKSLHIFNGRIT